VIASSKEIPCLRWFAAFFRESQSEENRDANQDKIDHEPCGHWSAPVNVSRFCCATNLMTERGTGER